MKTDFVFLLDTVKLFKLFKDFGVYFINLTTFQS